MCLLALSRLDQIGSAAQLHVTLKQLAYMHHFGINTQ
jgi:hypothetical protein